MHDIVTKDSYGRQFEAIQHCFRIIGFTDEVRDSVAKALLTLFRKTTSSTALWFCGCTKFCEPQNLCYDGSELWKHNPPLRRQDQTEVPVSTPAILSHYFLCK